MVMITTTLARWMMIMELSGIDSSVFHSHSFSTAATSKLINKGFSIKDIVKSGLWKSKDSFKKFY